MTQCTLYGTHACPHPPRPSPGVCSVCPKYAGPVRGLGDVVATVTKAVGMRPCGGCGKRRQALNRIVPRKG